MPWGRYSVDIGVVMRVCKGMVVRLVEGGMRTGQWACRYRSSPVVRVLNGAGLVLCVGDSG